MRLGSGTVDLLPGLTYTGALDDVSWGFQALGTVRIGYNQQGYKEGNRYQVNTWGRTVGQIGLAHPQGSTGSNGTTSREKTANSKQRSDRHKSLLSQLLIPNVKEDNGWI